MRLIQSERQCAITETSSSTFETNAKLGADRLNFTGGGFSVNGIVEELEVD